MEHMGYDLVVKESTLTFKPKMKSTNVTCNSYLIFFPDLNHKMARNKRTLLREESSKRTAYSDKRCHVSITVTLIELGRPPGVRKWLQWCGTKEGGDGALPPTSSMRKENRPSLSQPPLSHCPPPHPRPLHCPPESAIRRGDHGVGTQLVLRPLAVLSLWC